MKTYANHIIARLFKVSDCFLRLSSSRQCPRLRYP
jgi:hypothetical protein